MERGMPSNLKSGLDLLADLFTEQLLGVVATNSGTGPYVSLVAFAVTPDLNRLVFLTQRGTSKFSNIESYPQVSMLIDNRTNTPSDLVQGVAVTALGHAAEVQGASKKPLLQLFLAKHPDLACFANEPTTTVIEIIVSRFIVVSQFEKVQTFDR